MCRRMIEDNKKIYRSKIQKERFFLCSGLIVMAILLVMGTTFVSAQTEGLYFIANNNTNAYSPDATTNWYLVPASNGGDNNVTIDKWTWNNNEATPLVTTYQTQKDDNSIWAIVKNGDNSNYYFIHIISGNYITYNTGVGNSSNRRTFHMETNPTLSNNHLFNIISHTGNFYSLNPVSVTSGNMYMNPSNGNKSTYYASATTDGNYTVGGTIGLYNKNATADAGSKWFLVPAPLLAAPTISDVSPITGRVTITDANSLPAGYTIRYTTDGTDPTATTGDVYSSPIEITSSDTVKALVVRYGLVLTQMASKAVTPVVTTPVISFDNTTNETTIYCTTIGATLYYTTDGSTPTTSSTEYTDPISITTSTTVKAIAVKGGTESDMATLTITQVATPTIQDNGSNAVSITSATSGATIYYTTNGEPPTTSSTQYTVPLTENVSGVTIKAIAVKENMINSAVDSGSVTLQCETPAIRRLSNTSFTVTCAFPSTGVTIYYTTDGSTPTKSSSSISPGSTVVISLPATVKAIAVATNYSNSAVAIAYLTEGMSGNGTEAAPYTIEYQSDVSDFITKANTAAEASKHYKVTATEPLDFSEADAITQTFSGIFDGNGQTLIGLTHALFNTVNGGVVKNVMLKGVAIKSAGDTVGAITNIAKGYTRVYNCGILPNDATFPEGTHPTVTTSGNCAGGLVGSLQGDSRVINCFSYADVQATNTAAGIVGCNTFASTAAVTDGKYADLRTAIVNCMFYGNITGGTNRYPVYGGAKIVNNTATGINNYDFYRAEASVGTLADYNCSWPAKEEYLTKYEFYRNLLNSNRELCGWWVGAASAPSTMTTTDVQNVAKDASLMAKWVLDPAVAPYPILKSFGKYASPVNIDFKASWRESANEWEGKKLGTISVTINPGSHAASGVNATSATDFIITDMDTLHGDFCYRKIQLPYYNTVFGDSNGDTWAAKYGGNYGDYVVTGWEITSITKADDFVGPRNSFTADWATGYDFADRNCIDKDIYNASNNKRIIAQGGFYYVPDSVKSITITAHWASAIYLDNTDHYYDCVSVSSYQTDNGVSVGSSSISPFEPAGTRSSTLDNGKTSQNGSISSNIPSSGNVYDNAIVLVGNHQYFTGGNDIKGTNASDGCTIMSADFNFDEEPDNCLIWQLGTKVARQSFCPIRFDFLPILEMGMAMKEDGSTQYYSLGCYRPLGHFEVTETALIHFGQFEFSNKNRTAYAPLILNGGIYDQYAKGTNTNANSGADDKIDYIILGGNVRMPSFTPGAHVNTNAAFPTRHCAVNIIGGNIDNIYLTGNYNESVTPNTDNPHCYIDGGRLKHVAAAGKEGINGDVYFKINHSKIWEFYGGSTLADKRITGNINVTISNSIVDKYCGGPKFGDMYHENDKTVTTNAIATTFGVYYGGGNGGTSYVQYDKTDGEQTVSSTFNWNGTGKLNNYNAGQYRNETTGYMADYDMEIVNLSTGTNQNRAVYRTYFHAAQFSATNTGSITNNLTDCTVLTNFYGAGNLGGVKGNVTSTLTNTKVYGSAFGAGYSAAVPDVTIHNKNKTVPTINVYTGIITSQSGGDGTTYTWTNKTSLGGQTLSTSNPAVTDVTIDGVTKNYFYTEIPLDSLGAVNGAVSLIITGNSRIGTLVGDNLVEGTGNVYGGGDMSAVSNTTNPTYASTTVTISGSTEVLGNVYGGGNQGDVSGSTTVNIQE